MIDTTTTYLGLKLKNPIVPSSSPLSRTVDSIRRMEDAGAAAVVMYSLFEEQLAEESQILDHFLSYGTDSSAEAMSYFPEAEDYHGGPEEYLETICGAKEATGIPIIGSLNGVSTGGWTDYAQRIQQAGADALELNVYYVPTHPDQTGAEVEQMYVDVVKEVRRNVTIPIAVKLSPFFSATANMAKQLAAAGADGLVLFNRFYQPDLDLEKLEVVPHLALSQSHEMRLPLRWIAILHGRVNVDLALSTGVHRPEDALKALMAGAKVAMTTSALLQKGPERIAGILKGMVTWLEDHEYESVRQMQGSMSQKNVAEPAAFERANYMKVLQSWSDDPAGQLPV